MICESRSSGTTVTTRCGACVGTSCFNRSAIRVVLTFWCSWQMRQSLQPVLLVERFLVCWLSTCVVALDVDGKTRP